MVGLQVKDIKNYISVKFTQFACFVHGSKFIEVNAHTWTMHKNILFATFNFNYNTQMHLKHTQYTS